MHISPRVLAAYFTLFLRLPPLVGGAATNTTRAIVTPGNSHSLPESYQFDSRDGWESVIVTNLRYKYRRSPAPGILSATTSGTNSSSALKRPSNINTEHSPKKSVFRSIRESLAELTKGMVAGGNAQRVTITWYTGQDLLNPSCWANTEWAPTDESFVAALTLDGWSEKPKCFKFIELCNNSSYSTKCTFARVVDTCAGCAKGSRHVDLTRAAFKQLASLDEGILDVQMREASDPMNWNEELWGPRDP